MKRTMLAIGLITAGAALAPADATHYRSYDRGYYPQSAAAFARRAWADGRLTKDERRIIRYLQAQESRRHYVPRYDYRPYQYRWW